MWSTLKRLSQAALLTVGTFSPSSPPLAINLTITPLFNTTSGDAIALSTILSLNSLSLRAGDTLVTLPLKFGNVPANDYSGDHSLRAADEEGSIGLRSQDHEDVNKRDWLVSRDVRGTVQLSFTAMPRAVTPTTRPGPRVDLRTDQGGLIGSPVSFLPLPPDQDQLCDITFTWNMDSAPPGTSAAWTWGDGATVYRRGTLLDVLGTYLAVGPFHSYTNAASNFGMYWFGEPHIFNATQMAPLLERVYERMGSFFDDPGEAFRIFVRKSVSPSFGGSAQQWSFILEYYDGTVIEDEAFLFDLIVHAMAHNWPIMEQKEVESGTEDPDSAWYVEGMATYYAATLPYDFGLYNESQFTTALNNILSQYYTSPARHFPEAEAARLAWQNTHAQRLPYYRGATYLFYLRAQITRATRGKQSIDDSVRGLIRLRRTPGTPFGIEQWQEILEAQIGPVAHTSFAAMKSGKWLIRLPQDTFGPCFSVDRADQYDFDLGFDLDVLGNKTFVVKRLQPGSRAELAGLRNDDRITWYNGLAASMESYRSLLKMRVLTPGKDEESYIEYWPRSWQKTEAWEVRWIGDAQGDSTCGISDFS
ncbi:hypothetical protein PUNSTDRAFT_141332 [Punctularia strigosozonata HHB-11173 SS5]|uniref:uncharacterized protein n=1 Tax=Punctularia strigosozonata (strain HHB-11173) TaxID=741275 RepID=UPI0004416D63|nr:uncharacterized protein PUNSTDRAFT_141332 [Punctularia strigosozonata HHB-11173 SS5]EIN12708.1 hypothetical protein PUNSTDRAFT_141332 [Punctularia strigosozonata HHB-11173 SS5]